MNTNHAPAPWTADGGIVLDAHKEVVCEVRRSDGRHATANLIATAPELYKSLLVLRRVTNRIAKQRDEWFFDEAALLNAQTLADFALEKAERRTS